MNDRTADPGAIPARLGKYDIRGTLGRGAMGVVLDGWDPVIDRRVAIKTLPLPAPSDDEAVDALDRFKREAQAAGRLTHPNIVGVFDYGETDTLAYIVMEFVEGRSLADALKGAGPMQPDVALRLALEILAGLAYSHGRGVVHRDIKPANVMLTKDDQAKIADFGIARIESSSMTTAGTVMGTPAYMPPEQFLGQVADRRSDIYSCGVMLYQMLTGERPFEGSLASIMHKVMNSVPPRPSELVLTVPAALDAVVARAMARRPEDRYDTAAEFAAALRGPPTPAVPSASGYDTGDATVVARGGPPPQAAGAPSTLETMLTTPPVTGARAAAPATPAPARRSMVPVLAGVGIVVLAGAGAAAWILMPGSRPEPTVITQSPVITQPPVQQQPVQQQPAQQPPVQPSVQIPPTQQQPVQQQPVQQAPPVQQSPVQQPPPVQQSPVQQPPVVAPKPSPATVAAALALQLPGIPCSLLQAGVNGGDTAEVTGLAGAGTPARAARQAVDAATPAAATIAWAVRSPDGPVCPVLDYLRTLPDGGLRLDQDGGAVPLADGDMVMLRATMPGFAGYLHVAYLQKDGDTSILLPGPGYPAQTYAARTVVPLGAKHGDFAGWTVGGPFGTDMVVAVASTAPLFTNPPGDQPVGAYLSSLQAAIEGVRRRGGTVAVTAQAVDTVPARPAR